MASLSNNTNSSWCAHTAQVFKGRCKACDEIVAIKRLDLDRNWDLVRLLRLGQAPCSQHSTV